MAVCSPVGAAPAAAPSEALTRFAHDIKTFEAHFEQVQTDDHGQVTGRSSGHFWLARPAAGKVGRFRWAYEKPYQQLTVCDGDKLWAYDPDLAQVTERGAQLALAGTPAELLSQQGGLTDAFTIEDAGSDTDGQHLKLKPRAADSDFKSIELSLAANGAPLTMHFFDAIGGESEIRFSEVKSNAPIDAAQFRFTPPKGVEIVQDGGPATRPLE